MPAYGFNSQKEVDMFMRKKTKGFVTELTKKTLLLLKENTRSDLYGETHVTTKKSSYKRTGGILKSITMEKTDNLGESFYNKVYFDQDIILSTSNYKNHDSLGAHTDIYKVDVGDRMIEESWLEDGTSGGLVPRGGAGMLAHTEQDINAWLDGAEFEAFVKSEMGDIIVEKFK